MSEEETEFMITELAETVLRLEQQLYWQQSVILGMRDYLAVSAASNRESVPKQVSLLARKRYDEIVTRIGDHNPSHAERIDVRPSLPGGDTDYWQFPRDRPTH